MFYLENKLIYMINLHKEEEAINLYKEIISSFPKDNTRTNIRNLKNYIISLTSILYRVSYSKPICKKSLFKSRMDFIDEVEALKSVEEIIDFGQDLVVYFTNIIKEENKGCSNPVIREAIKYIHDNIENDLILDMVANEIFISKNYLSNLFSSYLNCSFSDYINKLRIEKAKVLLKDESFSLMDIAMECGFNSQSYFCYIFKKYEHMTPKQYRSIK